MSPRTLRAAYVLGAGLGEARRSVDVRLENDRLTGTLGGRGSGGGAAVDVRIARAQGGLLTIAHGGRTVAAHVVRQGETWLVSIEGRGFEVLRDAPGARALTPAGAEPFAVSPMTGLVAKVTVGPGQSVAAGQELFVVEAMKMEYVVRASRAATVAEVRRQAGDKVLLGEVVVAFRRAPGVPT